MIKHGLRLRDLGTERLSWRDLWVIVTQQDPAQSAVHRALNPDDAPWNMHTFLLAETVDTLRTLVWFKTKDGQKGRNRPKPIPRPGYRPNVLGKSKGMTIAEADVWLKSRVASG